MEAHEWVTVNRTNPREMLNNKIEVCLELFESLNDRLGKNKHPLFRFFDVVKANIINILNEIVENYTFTDPAKLPYEGKAKLTWELEEKYDESRARNEVLLNKLRTLEEEKEENMMRIEGRKLKPELEDEVSQNKQRQRYTRTAQEINERKAENEKEMILKRLKENE